MARYFLRSHVRKQTAAPEKLETTSKKPGTLPKKSSNMIKKPVKKGYKETLGKPKKDKTLHKEQRLAPEPSDTDESAIDYKCSNEDSGLSSQESSSSSMLLDLGDEVPKRIILDALAGISREFQPRDDINIPEHLNLDQVFDLSPFHPLPPKHEEALPIPPKNLWPMPDNFTFGHSCNSQRRQRRKSSESASRTSMSKQNRAPSSQKPKLSPKHTKAPITKMKSLPSKPTYPSPAVMTQSKRSASSSNHEEEQLPVSTRPNQIPSDQDLKHHIRECRVLLQKLDLDQLSNGQAVLELDDDDEDFSAYMHYSKGDGGQKDAAIQTSAEEDTQRCSVSVMTDFPSDDEIDDSDFEVLFQGETSNIGVQTTFCDDFSEAEDLEESLTHAATQTSFDDGESLFENPGCLLPSFQEHVSSGKTSLDMCGKHAEASRNSPGVEPSSNMPLHDTPAARKMPRKLTALKKKLFHNEPPQTSSQTLPRMKIKTKSKKYILKHLQSKQLAKKPPNKGIEADLIKKPPNKGVEADLIRSGKRKRLWNTQSRRSPTPTRSLMGPLRTPRFRASAVRADIST